MGLFCDLDAAHREGNSRPLCKGHFNLAQFADDLLRRVLPARHISPFSHSKTPNLELDWFWGGRVRLGHVRLFAFHTHAKDGHDGGMVTEPADRLSLSGDPLRCCLIEAISLDQPERDIAIEERVVGQIDKLLTAFAKESLDLIAAAGK